MLGNDLRIRRFTPQAERVAHLLPADIGRQIGAFKPKIDVPELEQLFRDVIDNLTIRQGEVRDKEGRTYSMSIRPCRTGDNRIDGAVMTLFDITERKQSAGRWQDLQARPAHPDQIRIRTSKRLRRPTCRTPINSQ